MSTPVEQIKERLSIVDVVGGYIKLEKAGGSYKALCPFHNEKTPSFNVSPARQAYYCFGCNRGGDIFSFVEEIEGVEFVDALRVLADRAGVTLKRENMEEKSARERLYAIMEEATDLYEKHLERNPDAQKYLTGRGLRDTTIRSFRIGFAPLEWRTLYTHLREKGFSDEETERAGLTKRAEGKGYYDRFRGRIMFPIFDANGRVVAFSGRVFGEQKTPDGTDVAKYINSPETPLYDKSSVMFGYDRAKKAMRTQNFVILVEGQMDLIMAHQAGTENAVAVSGTALTEKHLALLKRLTDNAVFAFDADEAGLSATARAFQLALTIGMNVRVLAIPEEKDPADYILKNEAGWAEAVAGSKHIIDFYLDVLSDKGYDQRRFMEEVGKHVLPLILSMRSRIEQAHFILEIARKLGLPESAVWEEVKRLARAEKFVTDAQGRVAEEPRRMVAKTRRTLAEEEILGILLWQEANTESGSEAHVDVPVVRRAYEEQLRGYGYEPIRPSEDDIRSFIIRAEHTYEHGPKLKETIEEMLDTLENEVLKEKQAELMKKIAEAKMAQNKESEKRYLEEFQSYTPRIIALEDRKLKRIAQKT